MHPVICWWLFPPFGYCELLPWTVLCKCLSKAFLLIPLGGYLGIEMLGHIPSLCRTLQDPIKLFSIEVASFYIPTSDVWGFPFLYIFVVLFFFPFLTIVILARSSISSSFYLIIFLTTFNTVQNSLAGFLGFLVPKSMTAGPLLFCVPVLEHQALFLPHTCILLTKWATHVSEEPREDCCSLFILRSATELDNKPQLVSGIREILLGTHSKWTPLFRASESER